MGDDNGGYGIVSMKVKAVEAALFGQSVQM